MKIPHEQLRKAAEKARTCLGAALQSLSKLATSADGRTEEVLLQETSGRLSAVFQKLSSNAEDGHAAAGGLAAGLTALADQFTKTDQELASSLKGDKVGAGR